MNIRRKSCGVKCSGPPVSGSVSPVWARAALSMLRIVPAADRSVLGAEAALEQQRRGRRPEAFVAVVGGDERDRAVRCSRTRRMMVAEHVGQLRADDQQPLGVGLGRGDLQQRDELAGGGQPVLDQAVVDEFE